MSHGARRSSGGLGFGVLCAFALAYFASSASAAVTAEIVTGKDGKSTLRITAGPESDVAYLDTTTKSIYRISAGGPQVTPGTGCSNVPSSSEVDCSGQIAGVYANLGNGDNSFHIFEQPSANLDLVVTYEGGSGIDNVQGGAFTTEVVDGGGGNDSIGTGGNFAAKGGVSEVLKGGPGNDHLTGGPGPDLIHGGGGQDTMYGDFATPDKDDGVDHIDAAETVENGEIDADLVIDCGGKEDSYQKDERDLVLQTIVRNCEQVKKVTVELAGAGDPAAGANPVKPNPKDAIKAAVEAVIKATPEISGKITIPSGGKPKGK
jgi:Ca2+-binding RTX toxin-like protein